MFWGNLQRGNFDVAVGINFQTTEAAKSSQVMIVFAGRVHVKHGLGIPDRAAKRGAAPYVVVLPVTEQELKAELKRSKHLSSEVEKMQRKLERAEAETDPARRSAAKCRK